MMNRRELVTAIMNTVAVMSDTELEQYARIGESLMNGAKIKDLTAKKTTVSEPVVEKNYNVRRTVGFVEQRDSEIAFLAGKFCPKPVFNGITHALKNAGAKYNKDTKSWEFESLEKANAFMDEQAKRETTTK